MWFHWCFISHLNSFCCHLFTQTVSLFTHLSVLLFVVSSTSTFRPPFLPIHTSSTLSLPPLFLSISRPDFTFFFFSSLFPLQSYFLHLFPLPLPLPSFFLPFFHSVCFLHFFLCHFRYFLLFLFSSSSCIIFFFFLYPSSSVFSFFIPFTSTFPSLPLPILLLMPQLLFFLIYIIVSFLLFSTSSSFSFFFSYSHTISLSCVAPL